MLRERIACAYPGTKTVGLSLWVLEDRKVVAVAVGSAEMSAVEGYFERFDPETLVIEAGRQVGVPCAPFRASSRNLNIVHPGWVQGRLRSGVQNRMGVLAHNAWKIGYHHIVRRGRNRIGVFRPEVLTLEWLNAHSPPRRPREA